MKSDELPVAIETKLRAIAKASRHRFPTADIDVMLQQIELGRDLRVLPCADLRSFKEA